MLELNIDKIKELIQKIKSNNQTISTMESCTGGGLANAITSISGVSEIFQFGAVTYSNEAKIMLGGQDMKNIIEKYSVYSEKTAKAMAETIAKITNSTYGIGVTGQLGRLDPNNILEQNKLNQVDFSIYNSISKTHNSFHLLLPDVERAENKLVIINKIVSTLLELVKEQDKQRDIEEERD